ncbi:UNVERIFIED_CONTAM: hypothetical protein FKN15_063375 [Acipenser sinensis]
MARSYRAAEVLDLLDSGDSQPEISAWDSSEFQPSDIPNETSSSESGEPESGSSLQLPEQHPKSEHVPCYHWSSQKQYTPIIPPVTANPGPQIDLKGDPFDYRNLECFVCPC